MYCILTLNCTHLKMETVLLKAFFHSEMECIGIYFEINFKIQAA